MKIPAIIKIFIPVLLIITFEAETFASGIGIYGAYNYNKYDIKLDDSTNDAVNLNSTYMGGGLLFDTAVAKDSLINYRIQIGGGPYNFKFKEADSEYELYRANFLNSLGFGVVRTGYVRLWLGLQVGGLYFVGKNKDDSKDLMTGWGGTAGGILGLNFNFGGIFTLGFDGGYRYLYSKVVQVYNDSALSIEDRKYTMTGYEAFGSVAVILRLGDTYSYSSSNSQSQSQEQVSEKSNYESSPPEDYSMAPMKEGSIDYNSLPKATVKQLTRKYKSLREDLFRGSLYPRKFFRTPRKLRKVVEKNERILLVTTKSGKFKVLLLVPKDMARDFKKKIRSKKILNFVYSPVDVYRMKRKRRVPVIRFVDEITE